MLIKKHSSEENKLSSKANGYIRKRKNSKLSSEKSEKDTLNREADSDDRLNELDIPKSREKFTKPRILSAYDFFRLRNF